MKKLFPILLVAFAMTTMVSCEKDNDGDDSDLPLDIADNTLVYDGVTYTFSDVEVDFRHDELTLVSAMTGETQDNGEPLLTLHRLHITPNVWNRDFDLADQSQWPDDEVAVELILEGVFELSFEGVVNYNGDKFMGGRLDGMEYEGSSIFTSGNYRVSGNNDGTPITITVNGVLINGKTFQMKLVSGNYNLGK